MDGPIVVGTDGSETAQRAVVEAIQLAVLFDQPVHVVCAYRPLKATNLPKEFEDSTGPNAKVDAVLSEAESRARHAAREG